jgi:hypothetical protein
MFTLYMADYICNELFHFTQWKLMLTMNYWCFADRASWYNLSQWPTWCTNSEYIFYNPLHVHVSSNNLLILRRSNCTNTSSGIVTLSKWPSGAPVERELSQPEHRTVTMPDAVLIQFDLLRMSKILLETCTCRGLQKMYSEFVHEVGHWLRLYYEGQNFTCNTQFTKL